MPDNKKHHYVPKFYLRSFSESGNAINLYNLSSRRAIEGASIKGQCYRNYMYGKNSGLEQSLAAAETDFAEILQRIRRTELIPPPMTVDHELLVLFVILQHVRTASGADMVDEFLDGFAKQILRHDKTIPPGALDRVRIGHSDPGLTAVSWLLPRFRLAMDLHYKLVVAGDCGEFITSDHPVVLYNQFMSFRNGVSSTGLACKGLQIFLPISPRHLLIFYDSAVYTLGRQSQWIHLAEDPRDIEQLNLLQVANSRENLYYRSMPITSLESVVRRGVGHRRRAFTHIASIPEPGSSHRRSELIVGRREDLNCSLELSFLRVSRRGREWRNRFRQSWGPKPVLQLRSKNWFAICKAYQKEVEAGLRDGSDFFAFLDKWHSEVGAP